MGQPAGDEIVEWHTSLKPVDNITAVWTGKQQWIFYSYSLSAKLRNVQFYAIFAVTIKLQTATFQTTCYSCAATKLHFF
jgi:hypothetical protein